MRSASVPPSTHTSGHRLRAVGAATALAVVGALLVPSPAQAAGSVGQGTYENSSSKIKYSGTWKTTKSSSYSGGSIRTLSSSGYAQLSFTTSGVRWISRTSSASGIADVYIDGVKKATVDLYSATTQVQQVAYEVSGLPEQTHTIKVVRTGKKNAKSSGKNIQLDAFVVPDVHAPAAPTGLKATVSGDDVALTWSANAESDVAGYRVYRQVGSSGPRTLVGSTTPKVTTFSDPARQPGETDVYDVVAFDTSANTSSSSTTTSVTLPISARDAGTYENTSSAVALRGPWTTVSSSADQGGSYASLKAAGYAQLSFTTSGVRWVTRTDASSGVADVYLDGVKQKSVDLYSATTATRTVVYEAAGLSETTHTIRVVWTGTKNVASKGTGITLDAFVAPDVKAPAAPSGLAAEASGTDVVLTWTANKESDLQSYRVTQREDASPTRTDVATVDAGTTTLTVPGRTPGSRLVYDLVAVDTSGNASGYSTSASVTVPIQPKGAGRYENDDPAVTLNGPWMLIPSTLESGGSYASLNAEGFAQFSFSTSGVRWISRTNSYSGIADVYLDGVKQASVDLYSPTTKFQQVDYEAKGLPETEHTLRIVRSGHQNPSSRSSTIVLDSFVATDIYPPSAPQDLVVTPGPGTNALRWSPSPEPDVDRYRIYRGTGTTGALTLLSTQDQADTDDVDEGLQPGATYRYQLTALDTSGNESARSAVVSATVPITPLPAGTYQDDDPSVTKVGSWERSASSSDSGGSTSFLNSAGYAELSFATSGVRWITRTNPYSGMADVYLDGKLQRRVDLYSAATRTGQNVFEVKGLSETGHTIRIEYTGKRNGESTGSRISLDALVAPDLYAPATPAALTATQTRVGAQLAWKKSPDRDVASYRVLRRANGSTTDVLIGTTDPSTTSFTDAGLADAASYSWTVVARDRAGNDSPASTAAVLTTGADPFAGYPYRASTCPAATVTVGNAKELVAAIKAGTSGTVIRLKPGSYGVNYLISNKATADNPMWICGPRDAVFDGGNIAKGYGIRVNAANNLILAGMTVRNVQKGISVQYAKRVTIADVKVEQIGDEAIHLKNMTSDSTVIGNSIDTAGLLDKNYGEGVYIGTAQGNWCVYNDCQPDSSDRNLVAFNDIRGNSAESIEAKAGTNDGTMWKNTLDGAAITADDADSLIQVMGSGWVIAGNRGTNSPEDAIQIWNTDDGSYGLDNIVYDNSVATPPPGYVVHMPYVSVGNIVGCDNTRGAKGLSNQVCQN